MLTLKDFQFRAVPGIPFNFLVYSLEPNHEIWLEPCFNGFCVVLYKIKLRDKNYYTVIGEKTCTKKYPPASIGALESALKIANKKVKEFNHE